MKVSVQILAFFAIILMSGEVKGVINGKLAKKGEFLAIHQLKTKIPNDRSGHCTITFLNDTTAITASHCMREKPTPFSLDALSISTSNGKVVKPVNAFWYDDCHGGEKCFHDLSILVFPEGTSQVLDIKEKDFAKISCDDSVSAEQEMTLAGFGINLTKDKEESDIAVEFDVRIKNEIAQHLNRMQELSSNPSRTSQEENEFLELNVLLLQWDAYEVLFQKQISLINELKILNNNSRSCASCRTHIQEKIQEVRERRQALEVGLRGLRLGANTIDTIEGEKICMTRTRGYAKNNDGVNAAAGSGDSGGPLLNDRGEIAAINTVSVGSNLFGRLVHRRTYRDCHSNLSTPNARHLFANAVDCKNKPCAKPFGCSQSPSGFENKKPIHIPTGMIQF